MWSANHFCSIEGFFFVASLLSESYFMPPAEQEDIVVTGDINHKPRPFGSGLDNNSIRINYSSSA